MYQNVITMSLLLMQIMIRVIRGNIDGCAYLNHICAHTLMIL